MGIPLIVIICYGIGEIYKKIFSKKRKLITLLPIVLTFLGGIISIIIYYLQTDFLPSKTIIETLQLGLISGASSTGANQIIKQIYKKKEKK